MVGAILKPDNLVVAGGAFRCWCRSVGGHVRFDASSPRVHRCSVLSTNGCRPEPHLAAVGWRTTVSRQIETSRTSEASAPPAAPAVREKNDECRKLARGLLEAWQGPVCAIDSQSRIVAVNHAWTDFASVNGGTAETCGVGVSYLAECESAAARARGLRVSTRPSSPRASGRCWPARSTTSATTTHARHRASTAASPSA